MKRALVFIDEGVVKIVIGSVMKAVPLHELTAQHNLAFFDRLFSESQVIVVDSISPISKEGFVELIKSYATKAPQRLASPAVSDTAKRNQEPAAIVSPYARDEGLYYKSTAQTYIIVDDLPLDKELRGVPGSNECLSIPPGGAIDLTLVDKESVRKSRTLHRLISSGVLVPIAGAEVDRINEGRAAQIREENDSRGAFPVLDVPVSKFLEGGGPNRDAVTIDVSIDEEEHSKQMSRQQPRDIAVDSGGFESLEELFENVRRVESQPEGEGAKVEMPRSQIAPRPPVQKSGHTAKGISRA